MNAGFRWVAALLAVLAGGPGCGDRRPGPPPGDPAAVRCAVDAGPCVSTGPGARSVRFEVSPRPVRSLADLTFRVEVRDAPAAPADPALELELRMPGMAMGANRIALLPVGGGRYAGRGTVVRCASGRRDWEAAVSGPSLGTVRFAFEVDRP